MKILHCLDHSIPLHSGYTFRTRAILEHQRALGWETVHVTSAKHSGASARSRGSRWSALFSDCQGSRTVARLPVDQPVGSRQWFGAATHGGYRPGAAGRVARALAEFEWRRGDSRRTAIWYPGGVRVPRLLGGRGGRPRHWSGVGAPLSDIEASGNLGLPSV